MMDNHTSHHDTIDATHDVDVVVVGASIAGCTAARLYAQRGLRVALIERHRDPAHYKRLCTHYIQASARPTIERLGLSSALERAGAVRNSSRLWTRWGWITPQADHSWGYSVRRSTLDPLLRELTLRTPGVEGFLGWTVRGVVTSASGRVVGVEAQAGDSRRTAVTGRLVVGADGARSSVASVAGVDEQQLPNDRFFYWAHYRGLRRPADDQALMWLLEPDAAYLFPNDDVTVVTVAPSKAWLPAFDQDREGAFDRFVRGLPEGPDLDGAERIGALMGTRDHPLRRRPAAPRTGLVLVGDAATTSDPLWGVGCGWAFQSAEWLVDATANALTTGSGLRRGLRRYRRARRHLDGHERLLADSAQLRELNLLERAWFAAAVEDETIAERLEGFATRELPATASLAPSLLRRILTVHRAARAQVGGAPRWTPAADVARRELVVGGLRTSLLEAGDADAPEALVCLPGPLGGSEDFGHLVERASGSLRGVAVDLPGLGPNDPQAQLPVTIDEHAAQLGRVVDRLGITHAHLVLHDAAAWWGLQWAAEYPGRVASITLVGGGLPIGSRRLGPGRAGQRPEADERALATAVRLRRLPAERGLRRSAAGCSTSRHATWCSPAPTGTWSPSMPTAPRRSRWPGSTSTATSCCSPRSSTSAS
jgi:menaquinone-9 beta-reductase